MLDQTILLLPGQLFLSGREIDGMRSDELCLDEQGLTLLLLYRWGRYEAAMTRYQPSPPLLSVDTARLTSLSLCNRLPSLIFLSPRLTILSA